MQREILVLREALAVQRVEWAYLNRPDRLRALAAANFDRLQLLPMEPHQFGTPGEVAYPGPALPTISQPVEIQGTETAAEGL
ncbi:MAG: hypothetical protein B7Z10_10480 [Rhodobacterales bacterium 32-66-7]|nr:MAG: hypothetical protein B7Z10_10480 [Rhodobacterales bacterium 32-66-7]